jgi:glycosyltransferase involved in cell wall biosynthesis
MRQQFIGINPERLSSSPEAADPWPELRKASRPIGLHVGHLRRNRGLDLLVQAKQVLGDRIEIVVQGSPTFPPDFGVVEELAAAGVHVRRQYVPNLADLYRSADLYLFPARPELAGAIELPLGILEAVASRVPVLTNDFGAVRAALEGVSGVRITTPSTFVEDLSEVLDHPTFLSETMLGLPPDLHAERVTDAILELAGGVNA